MKLAFKIRKPTWFDFVQALERAGQVALTAALVLYPASPLLQDILGGTLDVDLAKKAALAGALAGVRFLWRWLLPDFGRSIPVTVPPGVTPSHLTPDAATDA